MLVTQLFNISSKTASVDPVELLYGDIMQKLYKVATNGQWSYAINLVAMVREIKRDVNITFPHPNLREIAEEVMLMATNDGLDVEFKETANNEPLIIFRWGVLGDTSNG